MSKDQNNDHNNRRELLEFPCDFPIKVVSKAEFALEDHATQVVHKHIPDMEYIPVTKNESRKGNYQAITIILKAKNQSQIDNIYQELSANESIIMVL